MIVNDLGSSMEGSGSDEGPALSVAREITDAGGAAIADTSDVSDPAGAGSLVTAAVGTYGRVDILINNAGIIRWAGPPDVDEENLHAHLAVHAEGTFNTVRAAWPHMAGRRYGRIVNTTSTGIFGLANNTSYATAKAAVIGLTRSLAVAGARVGIRANLVAPAASTRMAGPSGGQALDPRLVAPLACYLAHEECPVTGEIYAAGAGRFARVFIGVTQGWVRQNPTVEDIAGNWDAIGDESGYSVPAALMDWSSRFLAHLEETGPGT